MPVAFFVGENGSVKPTLLDAIAVLASLPSSVGGMNEVDGNHAMSEHSLLAKALRIGFTKLPKDRHFFELTRKHTLRPY